MAPKYRQLHTKTLDSFDFNEMPDDFTRVCWLLLPLIIDSAGRGIFNSAWIRSKMFPLRQDVNLDEIQKSFDWFNNREMIITYEHGGRIYFYIPNWKKYQSGTHKEAPSNLPGPELVGSKSGVSQDLGSGGGNVPESAFDIASESESAFDGVSKISSLHAAFVTGFQRDYYSNECDSWANEFSLMANEGVTGEDIKEAFSQLKGRYTITSPKSIKNAAITCKNNRINPKSNNRDGKKLSDIKLDNMDSVRERGGIDG